MAHRLTYIQGDPRLCQIPGSLEIAPFFPNPGVTGLSSQEESSCDISLQDRLGCPERQQDSLRIMDDPYVELACQPPGNDGGNSSLPAGTQGSDW